MPSTARDAIRERASAYAIVGLAAALPRVAVLLAERGAILDEFTEKSDEFAQTLVAAGTFGFVPGEPSAYTQPLYGWFLAALYWPFERHWAVVGSAQIAVAVATAWLVYEIGRRWISPRAGLVAAVVATLSPYLVWHDVHVNREVLDGFLAAALVLVTLLAADRSSARLAAGAGALAGLAVLGNARLVVLPLVVAAFLVWRRAGPVAVAAVVAAAAVTLTPWVARNAVVVGCATITTDARALWKANNPATYDTLARGGWLDDVPSASGVGASPEDAARSRRLTGWPVEVDECRQMREFRSRVVTFWREHPGEKARLAAQAAGMLWHPQGTVTRGRPGAGTLQDVGREWLLPLYLLPLYALAVVGVRLVPMRLAVLSIGLLAYVTAAAAVFAGATRYRVAWDFLPALLAAAALASLYERRSSAER